MRRQDGTVVATRDDPEASFQRQERFTSCRQERCYFDGGHFPLDEYADAMAEAIIVTFFRSVGRTMLPRYLALEQSRRVP